MLDASALRQFYPVVMTPSHDGKFFQNYVASLLGFVVRCERQGMPVQAYFHQGESLSRARETTA